MRDEELVQNIPRQAFGSNKVETGMQFRAESKEGASRVVTVVDVVPDSVRIDANHPLAGQTLHFDVKIVAVRAATNEEIQHGHAHGADGHHHHH
jgi:FKBP-type peptidyl-prolyl cis-trans isomerase SlyD